MAVMKVAIDFVMLSLAGLPILLIYLLAEPYHRGFFCNDESLLHPYKDDTVTMVMLVSVGITLPIVIILIIEVLRSKFSSDKSPHVRIHNWDVPGCIQNIYKYVGLFLFGAACCQLTTDIAKYSIGRLRPHFISFCNPQFYDGTNCNNPTRQHRYNEDYQCLNPEATGEMGRQMRLSFPSGHSSFVFYTMVFCTLYLQSRFNWRGSKLFKHLLQLSLLMLALFTALSRISDYKHHWSDVLAGSVLGVAVAVIVGLGFSDSPSREKLPLHRDS